VSLLVAVCLLAGDAGFPFGEAEAKVASVNGKYSGLLSVLTLPEDGASYGEVRDWGFWDGTAYKGRENLPKGFWVYVHPRWYIWREKSRAASTPTAAERERASVGGKYRDLAQVIDAPGDEAQYGAFNDWGWSGPMLQYRDAYDLPALYWVYVAPRWYLWKVGPESDKPAARRPAERAPMK
jgi:hypothetical protein